MLENFNEDKRKNSMTQFSDFHTGWSIACFFKVAHKIKTITQDQNIFELIRNEEKN